MAERHVRGAIINELGSASRFAHELAAAELREGLPFIEAKVVTPEEFDFFTTVLFAFDRDKIPKGLTEVAI